jgi:sugar phosphate isomerase/epimerase
MPVIRDKMDRIAMGTVLFRYRFRQTKPKEIETIKDELTLRDVPAYYKKRFNVNRLEFWSPHFESLETGYLKEIKSSIRASRSKLVNIQVDTDYDLASKNEQVRLDSLAHVKKWIDAADYLGSECVRVNPGRSNGSVEKSIESMKVVNAYARSKKLVMLTENHFGIEMNPDVHLRINQEAGPKNIFTLPDFGNYPRSTMYQSLEKILPHAYLVSAKVDTFNGNLEHVSYNFDQCVQLSERLGFKGVYSVEQWNGRYMDTDFEKIGDWLIAHVKNNI